MGPFIFKVGKYYKKQSKWKIFEEIIGDYKIYIDKIVKSYFNKKGDQL